MPGLLRRHLLPIAVILLLALGLSACKQLCLPQYNDVWVGSGYTSDRYDGVTHEPANVWIENPKMAASLAEFIKSHGVRSLVYRHDFTCTPKPGDDCPGCLVCTLNKRNVISYDCQPGGDLFVKAEIGPGTNVRAMTYWRR